ncbi:hypothetical protein [Embleya hyalina]|uniref:Uncharacterized protein n=1 Tax=Embleya hyalina TaxID=516124 RepID=A0A401YHN8_9ACTN|nr:hypothetical protein [Embleya hyalina]GCD94087.1 hypothetical protein EHYA_01743 [Embleya hyalina]
MTRAAAVDQARARKAVLEHLAAAAATRAEMARDLAAAETVDERRRCRLALRAAAALLHATIIDAHQHHVPTPEIAATTRTTVRAVAVLLQRHRDVTRPSRRQVVDPVSTHRSQALDAVADAARAHGTAHPATHAAIAAAHAAGVPVPALARIAGISRERAADIVLTAGTATPPAAAVATMRTALINTITAGPATSAAAEARAYRRLVRGDNTDR